MKKSYYLAFRVLGLFLLLRTSSALAAETALERYVRAPDPAYHYDLVSNHSADDGTTTYLLKFTSQTWLTSAEVDRTNWWHWLTIQRPKEVVSDTALLFITGGNNKSQDPPKPDNLLQRIAEATKTVVVELRQVPNQPLVFNNDGVERVEDNLIAYGWDKFLRGGRSEWLARLPMTKSAVKAMDTVTEFLGSPERGSLKIDKFVVAGASKRGWTTWTTAVADKRVVAIAPIVIDMLNLIPSMKHHWEAYGYYSPAVGDYVRQGIMDWQGTPEYASLLKIVEPYEYRDRLTMPKLMIDACGDQYFLPDSHRFYFADLKGPKYMRYVPNADHSLRDTDVAETLTAWQYAITHRRPLPKFDWQVNWERGEIAMQLTDKPAKILLWQATNPEARDFRLETLGKAWSSSELKADADGKVLVDMTKPDKGWTAFMVELTYPIDGCPTPLKVTSGVAIVPDILPFAGKMPKVEPNR
ncbi:hypothetical protein GC207_06170 [bacterium]|nr:hypothetical protein [bacterium]